MAERSEYEIIMATTTDAEAFDGEARRLFEQGFEHLSLEAKLAIVAHIANELKER